MEANGDGLRSVDNRRPCFPVRQASVSVVMAEFHSKDGYNGDLGRLVQAESGEIDKDPQLKAFVDKASGWFEDRGGGDRAAFLDGATLVHRMLRQQGKLPRMDEDPTVALDYEIDSYQKLADTHNQILTDILTNTDQFAFLRIPELLDQPLGRALKEMTDKHPSKPSFVVGAEMMYSVLKQADLQALSAQVNVDDELNKLLGNNDS